MWVCVSVDSTAHTSSTTIHQKAKHKPLMPSQSTHTSSSLSSSTTPILPCSSAAALFRSVMAAVATETPFHVLAVDDSLPDRKLIERLLKTSSFQGKLSHRIIPVSFAQLLCLCSESHERWPAPLAFVSECMQ